MLPAIGIAEGSALPVRGKSMTCRKVKRSWTFYDRENPVGALEQRIVGWQV